MTDTKKKQSIARQVAQSTRDAYSFDRYGEKAWTACAILFESWEMDAEMIEETLRHKIMRWTMDAVDGGPNAKTYPANTEALVYVLAEFVKDKESIMAEITTAVNNNKEVKEKVSA